MCSVTIVTLSAPTSKLASAQNYFGANERFLPETDLRAVLYVAIIITASVRERSIVIIAHGVIFRATTHCNFFLSYQRIRRIIACACYVLSIEQHPLLAHGRQPNASNNSTILPTRPISLFCPCVPLTGRVVPQID